MMIKEAQTQNFSFDRQGIVSLPSHALPGRRLTPPPVPALLQFAQFRDFDTAICQLSDVVVPEPWGAGRRILKNYCVVNFEIAARAQQLWIEPELERVALWRVGTLTTPEGREVFMQFSRAAGRSLRPYRYERVVIGRPVRVLYRDREKHTAEVITITDPPLDPRYDIPPYRADFRIEYNWEHFPDRADRLALSLPGLTGRPLHLCIFGAVELAHRLWRKLSVPQYWRGRYQWLLPLHLSAAAAAPPDIVAALQSNDIALTYTVATLLRPAMAYANARPIVSNTDAIASWLANPDQDSIQARPQSVPMAELVAGGRR